MKRITGVLAVPILAGTLVACAANSGTEDVVTVSSTVIGEAAAAAAESDVVEKVETVHVDADRTYSLSDGEDIIIDAAGVYEISGTSENSVIIVDAGDEDEVTIVLSGVSMTNADMPCINVKNAEKVTVKTEEGTVNRLVVSGEFSEDDESGDAVVYSKDDLVFDGDGTLVVGSSSNAIQSNDDLKIKGGTYEIDCVKSALKAHDEIKIENGSITINSCYDGIHAEDNDDDAKGSILITGGTIIINAEDDALHATTTVQIDDGTLTLTGAECIEGTQITINGGDVDITASDDGINAAAKSSALTPVYEQNGGNITVKMGGGDTDGVDSNGNIYINGGTIDITGQSTFDCDGESKYIGGTIIENGRETNTITNQVMGGHGGGRMFAPDGEMPSGEQRGRRGSRLGQ